jgi:hypothetical protein
VNQTAKRSREPLRVTSAPWICRVAPQLATTVGPNQSSEAPSTHPPTATKGWTNCIPKLNSIPQGYNWNAHSLARRARGPHVALLPEE